MKLTLPPRWANAKVYVDEDLLPLCMGVCVDPTPASVVALAYLHQSNVIEPREQGAT